MKNVYKNLYPIGIISYLLLIILSAIFYKERTIFTDTAYQLFYMLKNNSFVILNARFGVAATEIFPLMASRAGLPLNSIIFAYSVGFMVYYFVCFLICGLLKQYEFGLLLLFINILFITDTFYWIQTELPQGLALMMVFFALVNSGYSAKAKFIVYPLLMVLVVFLVFFHPLIIFPFYYIIAFSLLSNDQPAEKRKILYGAAIAYVLVLIVKMLVFTSPYDKHAIGNASNLYKLFPNYFLLHSNRVFLEDCFAKYYWIALMGIVITVVYIRSKQWLKLSLFICASVGYLLLVNISYPDRTTPLFYIENLYLPMSIFIGFPFLKDVVPTMNRKLAIATLALVAVTGCLRIYTANKPYVARLNMERHMIDTSQGKKILILQNSAIYNKFILTWATPYEFWLLSTIEYPSTASIVVMDYMPQADWAWDRKKEFIGYGCTIPYRELPAKYFHFKDTVSGYTLIR